MVGQHLTEYKAGKESQETEKGGKGNTGVICYMLFLGKESMGMWDGEGAYTYPHRRAHTAVSTLLSHDV